MTGKIKSIMKSIKNFFVKVKSERARIAKWLFEKLLGSFMISSVVSYGGIIGLHLHQSSFQTVYSTITILSVLAWVLGVVLIPSKKKVSEKYYYQKLEKETIDEIAKKLESELFEKGISIDLETLKSAFSNAIAS